MEAAAAHSLNRSTATSKCQDGDGNWQCQVACFAWSLGRLTSTWVVWVDKFKVNLVGLRASDSSTATSAWPFHSSQTKQKQPAAF
jgi:hypothetical protein